MPRLHLDLPAAFPFATRIAVRVDDINYGGHLANDAVLSLAHEARIRWLRSLGFASELDVAGTGLIMADAAVVYRAEGRHGMELRVEVAPADVRSRSFDLLYRLSDEATGEEIARVKTGMLWFDYAARKLARAPEAFLRAVQGPAPG
jgi:acyl-CoA thioester hydrolase